jgi:hypothetical protein
VRDFVLHLANLPDIYTVSAQEASCSLCNVVVSDSNPNPATRAVSALMRYARICAMLAFQRESPRTWERGGTDAGIMLSIGTHRSAFSKIWG